MVVVFSTRLFHLNPTLQYSDYYILVHIMK